MDLVELLGMHIGVTGSRGTIGKLLVRQLEAERLSVSSFPGDIRSVPDVQRWVNEGCLDAVYHLAAVVPTHEVEAQPAKALAVNVGGTANLIDALSSCQRKPWFFLASSSHVYKSSDRPIAESDPIEPVSVYGWTKRMAEEILEISGAKSGLVWCIGRIFSFYDESQQGSFLYPAIRRRLASEDLSRPFVLSGMDDIRDISPAISIVKMMTQMQQAQLSGVFNLASGRGIRIRDFVQSLAQKPLDLVNSSSSSPTTLVADVSKLRSNVK